MNLLRHFLHRPAELTALCLVCAQAYGVGAYILNFHPAPRWNVHVCSHGWQDGGGLYISGTSTATLTNTNVYENQAVKVCLHVKLSLTCHPVLRCRAVLKFDP